MNQDKKIQVVMLVTDKTASLCLAPDNKLYTYNDLPEGETYKGFELLFLSDDEIKYDLSLLNTFIYNSKENEIDKITSKADILFIIEENKESNTFKKIIASTDKSLMIDTYYEIEGNQKINLPEPSKEWIEYFVSEYNKGSIIKEVFVEYEKY